MYFSEKVEIVGSNKILVPIKAKKGQHLASRKVLLVLVAVQVAPYNLPVGLSGTGGIASPCLQFPDLCQANRWRHEHDGRYCQHLDVLRAGSRASSFAETRE